MAESNKFGGLRPQFGDARQPVRAADSEALDCSQCEAMLADALDGTLSAVQQALFDRHIAVCGPCEQALADAKRGAAWLQMLHESRPEPPALLLERILSETSGQAAELAPMGAAVPVAAGASLAGSRGVVLPFRQRAWAMVRRSGIGQIALQPRLAMTAAMAFFSLALTMDITGLRPQDLRPANFRPSNLKRGFYSAKTGLVQYYEGLRVVYELESRVHDLQGVSEDDSDSNNHKAPATKEPATPPAQQPNGNAPAKKSSTTGGTSGGTRGGIRPERPNSRVSLARYTRERELAEVDTEIFEFPWRAELKATEGRVA